MNSINNSVTLIGKAGADAEVKDLDKGKKLAKISIATNSFYVDKNGEKVQDTQWHNVIAWGKTAEIAGKYVEKGKSLAIQGKLSHRTYDDPDGVKKYITEVVANELLLL